MPDSIDLTALSDEQLMDLRIRSTREADRRETLLTGLDNIEVYVRRYCDAGGDSQDIIDLVTGLVNQ